ncbi:hypothetical protein F511_13506 [Dorcoceras hygrometricum]|uniref:Uncharacterized protein n=1 Tax=Dorcoceras hygrometricum TaxID=472368 RepID=A0A2Z7AA48_9LAMI|nr:hypothetical protein F511_13506 [Dorcoceras hygrometricum]
MVACLYPAAALFRVLRAKRQRFAKLARRRLDVATGTSCEDLFACVCRMVFQLRSDVNAGQRSCSLRLDNQLLEESITIGYPRTRASGESSTTNHRLLHASGPHPTPPPDDPN